MTRIIGALAIGTIGVALLGSALANAPSANAAGWDGPAAYRLWECGRSATPPHQLVCTWYGW